MSKVPERALDAVEDMKPTPATHIIYTAKWELAEDGGKFYDWIPIDTVWRDDRSGFIGEIHAEPTNREKTATAYFHCVPVGAPPPAPLTITRDEFLEQRFAACHG